MCRSFVPPFALSLSLGNSLDNRCTTTSSFDDEKLVRRSNRTRSNGRIIYDDETFLWLVSPRRQFAASPEDLLLKLSSDDPCRTSKLWFFRLLGMGGRITACPIFNFAVRFVADNARNHGVEITCDRLYCDFSVSFCLILSPFIIIIFLVRCTWTIRMRELFSFEVISSRTSRWFLVNRTTIIYYSFTNR